MIQPYKSFWIAVINLVIELENCNPEVGMGKSDREIATEAWSRVGCNLKAEDWKKLISIVKECRSSS